MLKIRKDFPTEEDYYKYTKSSDFLDEYNWEGKGREQIIYDMALPDFEQEYLDEAMEELIKQKSFDGFLLDRLILHKLDLNEPEDDFDPEDVIYIKRNMS